MGTSKTISISDLKQGNTRLCLSALRVFGKCYQCPEYEKKIPLKRDGDNWTYKSEVCESRIINAEYDKKQAEIKEKLAEIQKLQKEIEELRD